MEVEMEEEMEEEMKETKEEQEENNVLLIISSGSPLRAPSDSYSDQTTKSQQGVDGGEDFV